MKKDYAQLALDAHKEKKGKIEIKSKMPVNNRDDLSIAYTPGVAQPCLEIAKDEEEVYTYTSKGNMVAVVTDGSAVLGLGDIGPKASLPVMEGKCVLFKEFGGVDALPICLDTQDTEKIIETVKLIAPSLGGINLEDISAPRCFEIEERLDKILDIPVFHDDQHGTAIVVLAGIVNAMKITNRKIEEQRIVMSGAGAAGVAIAKVLLSYGAKNIISVDRTGAIYKGRLTGMNKSKEILAELTNKEKKEGLLADIVKNTDIFIGVSGPGVLTKEMVKTMNKDSIIFAMANPTPEIMPEEALEAGAAIVATGRSDFPNQINNVLVFPGIFKGALEARAKTISPAMKLAAANALADFVDNPSKEKIIPAPFDEGIADVVAKAVMNACKEESGEYDE